MRENGNKLETSSKKVQRKWQRIWALKFWVHGSELLLNSDSLYLFLWSVFQPHVHGTSRENNRSNLREINKILLLIFALYYVARNIAKKKINNLLSDYVKYKIRIIIDGLISLT